MTAATNRQASRRRTPRRLRRLDARELRSLDAREFRSLVLDASEDSDLWAVLTGKEFRGDTASVLAAARRDIGIQLAARSEDTKWRVKGLGFQRHVDKLIAAFERATGVTLENTANAQALITLARAIAAHQTAFNSDDADSDPEPYDLALWNALEEARLTTAAGEIIPLARASAQLALAPA
jgi:hypothetical protein